MYWTRCGAPSHGTRLTLPAPEPRVRLGKGERGEMMPALLFFSAPRGVVTQHDRGSTVCDAEEGGKLRASSILLRDAFSSGRCYLGQRGRGRGYV